MQIIIKTFDYIIKLLIIVVSILLIFMVSSNVLFRFVIRKPLSWANELATYLFVWWVFLGSTLAVKEKKHLNIAFLKEKLPPKLGNLLDKVINVLIIIYCLVLTYTGTILLPLFYKQMTPFTRFPIAFIYVIIPFTGFAMIIYSLRLLFKK